MIGFIGTNIFLDSEGPEYPTGYGTSLGIICLALCAAITLETSLWKLQKKKDKLSPIAVREQYTDEQLDAMGDKSPLYKYML